MLCKRFRIGLILCLAICSAAVISMYEVPIQENIAVQKSVSWPLTGGNRLASPVRKPSVPSSAAVVLSVPKPIHPEKAAKPPVDFLRLQGKYHLVSIPTYDGSYQLTHPKILYFANKWNGYEYWMSMTPYPYERDIYENPSIVVSHDGKTWGLPVGGKNPVSGIPADSKQGGHYSDPQLVMKGNTMELWYRYNPSLPNKKKRRLPNNSVNIYYRKTSTDGVHWSQPEKLLESSDGHLSLCVNYEDGVYKTWWATYGGQLFYAQSWDAHNWSTPVACTVPLPKGRQPYHQDLIRHNGEYYLLQTAEKVSNYTFSLFLLSSQDGIHFKNVQSIYPDVDMANLKNVSLYRSTFFVKDDKMHFYISMILPRLKWYISTTTVPLPNASVQPQHIQKL